MRKSLLTILAPLLLLTPKINSQEVQLVTPDQVPAIQDESLFEIRIDEHNYNKIYDFEPRDDKPDAIYSYDINTGRLLQYAIDIGKNWTFEPRETKQVYWEENDLSLENLANHLQTEMIEWDPPQTVEGSLYHVGEFYYPETSILGAYYVYDYNNDGTPDAYKNTIPVLYGEEYKMEIIEYWKDLNWNEELEGSEVMTRTTQHIDDYIKSQR